MLMWQLAGALLAGGVAGGGLWSWAVIVAVGCGVAVVVLGWLERSGRRWTWVALAVPVAWAGGASGGGGGRGGGGGGADGARGVAGLWGVAVGGGDRPQGRPGCARRGGGGRGRAGRGVL